MKITAVRVLAMSDPVAPEHRRFAHALIDHAGVDLLHGHSSHHSRGIEVYNGKLILYGCGDFINDYEGISGNETLRGDLVLMYLPLIGSANGDDRACSEWHITGTMANGDKLDWLGLDLWQFDDDGKVVRCDAYYKSEGNLSGAPSE